ncbi:hypothetical protein L3Q82_022694 [Scortum barcoo]|uniref:Uncharacterized protein n=1 Tax=Scortum barcoo TaxID=214431 RepID=A0ACB8WXN7_9TELE|nr:hypothetical protein L3Q82_022694 [Scortum barcoo]
MSLLPEFCSRDWVVEAPLPRLLPKPHCTGPSWTFLRVVSLLEGGPTSPFRAEPGRVPWAKTRPPGARLRAPTPGLAPGWGPVLSAPLQRSLLGPFLCPHHTGLTPHSASLPALLCPCSVSHAPSCEHPQLTKLPRGGDRTLGSENNTLWFSHNCLDKPPLKDKPVFKPNSLWCLVWSAFWGNITVWPNMDPADQEPEPAPIQQAVAQHGILLGQHDISIQALMGANQTLAHQVSILTSQLASLLSQQSPVAPADSPNQPGSQKRSAARSPSCPPPESFSDISKIYFMLGQLRKGSLLGCGRVRQAVVGLTFSAFIEEFRQVFDVPASPFCASSHLLTITQGQRSVAEYTLEFWTLAAEVDWTKDSLFTSLSLCLPTATKKSGPPVGMGLLAGQIKIPVVFGPVSTFLPPLACQLQRLPILALIDSGAEESFIDEQVAEQAGIPSELLKTLQRSRRGRPDSRPSNPLHSSCHPRPVRGPPFSQSWTSATPTTWCRSKRGTSGRVRVRLTLPQARSRHPAAPLCVRLSLAEANYDVGNRELLVVKLALEEWRHWLEGSTQPFVVWTNHKNLVYIQTSLSDIAPGPGMSSPMPSPGSSAGRRSRRGKETSSRPFKSSPLSLGTSKPLFSRPNSSNQTRVGGLPGCIFVPVSVRSQVLQWAHLSKLAWHPGINRKLSWLSQLFFKGRTLRCTC